MNKEELLKTAIGFFSVLVSIKIAKDNLLTPNKIKVKESQLKNVYLPMFRLLEPNLYQRITHEKAVEYVKSIDKIIDTNFELINANLIFTFRNFSSKVTSNKPFNTEYEQLCSIVDREFEKTRRALSLPSRNIFHKYKANQLPDDTYIQITGYLVILIEFLRNILIIIVLGIALKFILSLLK